MLNRSGIPHLEWSAFSLCTAYGSGIKPVNREAQRPPSDVRNEMKVDWKCFAN